MEPIKGPYHWRLPPLSEPAMPCLNCGPSPLALSMKARLAVGFGSVTVTRDGEEVWSGDDLEKRLSFFEWRASRDPDHDWRVCFYGPLSELEYQRQGKKFWPLVRKGDGFA